MTESHLTIEDARRLREMARILGRTRFATRDHRDALRALTDELSRLTGEPIT